MTNNIRPEEVSKVVGTNLLAVRTALNKSIKCVTTDLQISPELLMDRDLQTQGSVRAVNEVL